MDEVFARELCVLNNRFYAQVASSFSATRRAPWAGWQRCLDAIAADGVSLPAVLHAGVLDVGCGNCRFERFLAEVVPGVEFPMRVLDSCAELAAEGESAPMPTLVSAPTPHSASSASGFEELDIMELLASGVPDGEVAARLQGAAAPFGLAVAFGFMHHVPLPAWRARLVRAMAQAAGPGGYVCLSLWRFMDDAGLAAKAHASHVRALDALGWRGRAAQFASGDYLLGWQHDEAAFRYCHSFTDGEIDELTASLSESVPAVRLVTRFRADGRTGALNEYLVFRVG